MRYWAAARCRRVIEKLSVQTPDLQPGAVAFPCLVVGRNRAVRTLSQHIGGPVEIIPQPFVQSAGDIIADQLEHNPRIDGEHNDHDAHVPERQPDAHAPRTNPLFHGSPSRSINPTPRTVWINLTG